MGLGYHLTEKMKYDPDTGVALTAGTWVNKYLSFVDMKF